ncbi:hypothetical protein F5141DRAFT_1136316, partial [Pisolithus sp. B1]
FRMTGTVLCITSSASLAQVPSFTNQRDTVSIVASNRGNGGGWSSGAVEPQVTGPDKSYKSEKGIDSFDGISCYPDTKRRWRSHEKHLVLVRMCGRDGRGTKP